MQNEVTKQRTLVRHERAVRLRETDMARAQLKRMQNDVGTPRTPRTPRTRVKPQAQQTSTGSDSSVGARALRQTPATTVS